MSHRLAAAAVSLMLVGPAFAAGPPYVVADHSTAILMDKAKADAIWLANLPETRLAKLYPPKKFGFLSQVVGGFEGQTCVVTARAMLLPRTTPTHRLVWEPSQSTATFGTKANATAAQCSELAAEKLKEAVQALVASLVKT